MQKKVFALLALLTCIFAADFAFSTVKGHSILSAASPNIQNETIKFQMAIHILDISQNNGTAKVKIFLKFIDFPYNATQVNAILKGRGDIEARFQCKTEGGRLYDAESYSTAWLLTGYGESYPFDSYEMDFNLIVDSVHFLRGNSSYKVAPSDTFNLTQADVLIPGPERRPLRDIWWIGIRRYAPTGITLNVQRNWQPLLFTLILPIVACFYFLGGTIFISATDLQSRMTAYVSIFVFAPIFLMTIQGSLPYRATLCFPEILLTLLLTGTATFAIFSMCPEDHISIPLSRSRMEMDEAAIFSATIFFLIIYAVSFYLCPPMFANPLIAALLLLTIFGYSFGWFLKKRLHRYPTGVLRSFGYAFLITGYIVTALGAFMSEFSQILAGIIFFVLGVFLIVISRRLERTQPRRRPFPPDKTGIEYIR